MSSSNLACIQFTAMEYEQIYLSYENKVDILRSLKEDADMWRNKFVNNPCDFKEQ